MSEPAAANEVVQPPPAAPLDARLYWARFDAEEAARQARLDSIDVRTPKIVTLCLLVPAAVLLVTATFNSLTAAITIPPAIGGQPEPDSSHVNPVNRWLAVAGGVLAVGTIGAGLWWRQRRVERRKLELQLGSASNGAQPRGPVLGVRVDASGVGLVVRARL
jgi:hypothetical protein